MGRTTVYNSLVGDKYPLTNKKNQSLLKEWVSYLHGVSKSDETIKQYVNNFKIWSVWNMENSNDKFFVDIKKGDVVRFQGHCLNVLNHSSARVRSLRATLSSLSNYIEAILDEEYPTFRNIINKIEAPTLEPVREKLIMDSEETEKILEELVKAGKYQQACCYALSCYGGARKSELLRFKTNWFTDENVENGLYKTPEKIKSKGRGKKGKMITKWTIKKSFDPYLKLWIEEREKLGIDSEWLFVRRKDNAWAQAVVSTANSWARTITRMLGKEFYFHSNRHYYTSQLVANGIPIEAIRHINSWSNISMVQVYNDRDSSEDFGKYFGEDGIKKQEKQDTNSL